MATFFMESDTFYPEPDVNSNQNITITQLNQTNNTNTNITVAEDTSEEEGRIYTTKTIITNHVRQ